MDRASVDENAEALTALLKLAVPLISALILVSVLVFSFAVEQYEPAYLVIATCAFCTLTWTGGWWSRNPSRAVILGADLALIFLYQWSLGERAHVVVQVTPTKYVARVGGDVAVLARPGRAGGIGLYAGGLNDFMVKPTGEAHMPATDTPQARVGELLRFAEPKPAWSNIRLAQASRRTIDLSASRLAVRSSSWSRNPRGELEGMPGSAALLAPVVSPAYTLSADLMRADGVQGLLVGLDGTGRGYLLVVRMDGNGSTQTPEMYWAAWKGGRISRRLTGAMIRHQQVLPMIQRDLRLLLGSVVLALALAVLVVPAYILLLHLLSLAPAVRSHKLRRVVGWAARPHAFDLLAVLAAGTGLVLAALIASSLLGRIPHIQDDMAFLFQAKILALGRLWAPAPSLLQVFNDEHLLVYHGHWFSKFLPGWPLLLAAGVVLGAPWLVNPALAAAVLLLLYLIGREVYGSPTALLATLLTLSSPFFLEMAGSFMAHTAALFYLSLFAYLLLRWSRRTSELAGATFGPRQGGWWLLILSGLSLGMALITHPTEGAAFALPFAALLWRRPAGLWVIPAIACPVVLLLLYNRALTGNLRLELYTLYWRYDRLGFGPHVSRHGFTVAQGLWNTSIRLEMLQAHLFGWPFYLALALPAVPFVLGRANRWDVIFALSALLVVGVYALYWWPGITYGPRYYYVAIPWFSLLAARGLAELAHWPIRLPYRLPPNRLAALPAPLLLAVTLVLYDLTFYMPAQLPLLRNYEGINPAPLNAVRRANIHYALIFVIARPPHLWASYGDVFSGNSPLLHGDIVYARDQPWTNAKLIHLYPGRNYYRLDRTKLTRLIP